MSSKKQSIKAVRYLRFLTYSQLRSIEESRKIFIKNTTVAIHQGPLFSPDWIGALDDYQDYWFNIEKEAGRLKT